MIDGVMMYCFNWISNPEADLVTSKVWSMTAAYMLLISSTKVDSKPGNSVSNGHESY